MKKTLIALAAAFMLPIFASAQSPADSLAIVNADWNWKDLGKGAKVGYAIVDMFGAKQSISVLKYPAKKHVTEIIDAQNPAQATVPVISERTGALGSINASYFNVRQLTPTTYFVDNRKVVGETGKEELFRADGYVALKGRKGRRIEIGYTDPAKYEAYPKEYYDLLVSGPVVLMDSQIPQFPAEAGFYDMRHPRTVIGYDAKGTIYYVVIDGRFPMFGAYGATIMEVALISRYLGMTYALNLDGGGSSTLWTAPTGVVNHPFDNRKFDHEGCRTVPNIIIMK